MGVLVLVADVLEPPDPGGDEQRSADDQQPVLDHHTEHQADGGEGEPHGPDRRCDLALGQLRHLLLDDRRSSLRRHLLGLPSGGSRHDPDIAEHDGRHDEMDGALPL